MIELTNLNNDVLKQLFNPGETAAFATIDGLGSYRPPNAHNSLNNLPDLPGVYLVVIGEDPLETMDQVLYVGSSKISVRKRMKSHHKMQCFNSVASILWQYNNLYLSQGGIKGLHQDNPIDMLGIFCWCNPFDIDLVLKLEQALIAHLCPPLNNLGSLNSNDQRSEVSFEVINA